MAFMFLRKAYDEGGGGGGVRAPRRPVVGLALGAGAARGWAHIGVLDELDRQGLKPDIVVGCSIGAVVGGAYAAGKLAEIEQFSRSLTKRRVLGLLDLSFAGAGLFGGRRLEQKLTEQLSGLSVESLPMRFAAVAAEVGSGHEVWLTRGDLVEAIRASYALPGIFEPVRAGGRWLFDGALVNPIPITVARALGADLVIAVNVNADTLGRGTVIQDHVRLEQIEGGDGAPPDALGMTTRSAPVHVPGAPGLATVMVDAFNITQDRITRSRLAGDPPDAMIGVKAGRIGLFEFHRAEEAIAMGREAVRRIAGDLREMTGAQAMA